MNESSFKLRIMLQSGKKGQKTKKKNLLTLITDSSHTQVNFNIHTKGKYVPVDETIKLLFKALQKIVNKPKNHNPTIDKII